MNEVISQQAGGEDELPKPFDLNLLQPDIQDFIRPLVANGPHHHLKYISLAFIEVLSGASGQHDAATNMLSVLKPPQKRNVITCLMQGLCTQHLKQEFEGEVRVHEEYADPILQVLAGVRDGIAGLPKKDKRTLEKKFKEIGGTAGRTQLMEPLLQAAESQLPLIN